MMLLISPDMKRWTNLYGDSLGFDITYNVVRSNRTHSKWGVGMFVAFDTNYRILPCGIVLMQKEDADSFIKVFRNFF